LLLLVWPGTALAKTTAKARDRRPPQLTWLQKPNPPLATGTNWPLSFRFNEKARVWLSVYNSKGKAVVRPLQGRWYRPGPLAVNLNLKNWPPGQYTLWITALDSSGNRSRWKMAFRISPKPASTPANTSGSTAGSGGGSAGGSSQPGNNGSGGDGSSLPTPPVPGPGPLQPSPPITGPVPTQPTPENGAGLPEPAGMTPEEQAAYYAVPRVDEVKNSAIPGYAIRFYLSEPGYVSIKIYNSKQQIVAVIYDRPTQPLPDGLNTVVWDKKVMIEPGRTDWASPGTYTWEVVVKKGDGTIVNRFSGEIIIN